MSLKLPRLPQHPPTHSELQIWWQKVCEAIETQEAVQDQTIADLAAESARIDDAVENIEDILVRLFDVEELADGTIAIVDQGLNADGTVKPNKVLTESAVSAAFADPEAEVSADVTIPSSGTETVLHTSSVKTVGDATYGSYTVFIQGTWNNATDPDAGAEIYLETNENAAGWVRQTDYMQTCGAQTTGGGDTKAYIPLANMYSNAAAGLETVQVRLVGKAIDLSAGLKDSTVTKPRSVIIPGKR